ncbi:MAG: adenylate/guanylate cyclase domain-containing protein [Desulfobulbaceae bacterium]|nr:adenylate/guanylate cyclase domain-containing protein [Desulfobulbaceae bacterium]HIJ78024.1 adenylate/guanylate cyclase domain-containing protein [Deltaproteobacteria bacterium]
MTDQTTPSTSIKLLDNPDNEKIWPLSNKKTYSLGRVQGNDIDLPYSWVSRKHAMIQVEENGSHVLIDLGSSNGTFRNGKRIYTPTSLQNGDCIGIGNTRLLFEQNTAPNRQIASPADELDERTVAFIQKETVTILICDIHDFTKLSEIIGDQRVSQLLQLWTGKVGRTVSKLDGIVDKFIGDAVMALWAGPNIQENIHKAFMTALAIDLFTSRLNQKIPYLPWQLEVGAALNTGEAMMGNLGQDGRQNYTVVGDVVNVAFRLEGMTSKQNELDLVIGKEVAEHLTNLESYFSKQSFELKGKTAPVEAYGCSFTKLKEYLTEQVE